MHLHAGESLQDSQNRSLTAAIVDRVVRIVAGGLAAILDLMTIFRNGTSVQRGKVE